MSALPDPNGRLPDPDPARPGPLTIGRFRVRSRLGAGRFGVVYLADDPQLGRPVALKLPRFDVLESPDLRARFVREAQAASRFDHPNLVAVYEADDDGLLCWFSMAYVDGPTLAEWLRAQTAPVPVRDAARLVATLAAALQHAHERAVLHC